MKKILAISFIAMSAVNAANANIASQAYVDDHTGTLTNLTTEAKTNLVAAINEVDSHADTNATAISNEVTRATGAENAINEKIGTLESGKTVAQMIADAKTAAQTGVSNLDYAGNDAAGVVTNVTEENGIIAATKAQVTSAEIAANAGILATQLADGVQTTLTNAAADHTKLGQTSAEDFTKLHDVTASAAELNQLDNITLGTAAQANVADSITAGGTGLATAGQVHTAVNNVTNAVNNLNLTDAQAEGAGNVIVSVTQENGQVAATKGNAVNAVSTTGTGTVITGVTLNADGQTIDVVKDFTAIPKPDGNCTDCVLHFNGTAYSWEEITRVTPAQQGDVQG